MSTRSPRSRLTPGRLLYLTYFLPLARLRDSWREGGPINQWKTRRGRRAMIRAAARLAPLPEPPAEAAEVSFLTGKRFWYQTAFCYWSLCQQSDKKLRAVFYDDGSFDDELSAECLRLFPGARIHRAGEIEARLERDLPNSRFPALRARRLVYLHLRKLTDIHAGSAPWQLVLDSDMLFFRRPNLMLDWLASPQRPLHMADLKDSYGYSTGLMSAIAGAPIPSRVNVGLCGLRGSEFDWEKLEHWCRRLQDAEGTSYYLEQALVAMLLAGRDTLRAPAEEYRLMPDDAECRRPTAAMHHYVDLSKRGYFRYAWRHVAT